MFIVLTLLVGTHSEIRLIKNGCRAFFLLKYVLSIVLWTVMGGVCGYAAAVLLIRYVTPHVPCSPTAITPAALPQIPRRDTDMPLLAVHGAVHDTA